MKISLSVDGEEMEIRPLSLDEFEAYTVFRREMWPSYAFAGNWETVRLKYFRNPHVALCPGSGLYLYLEGNEICGVMGAYPMPITLDGVVYPGHISVDWAVLPRFQGKGIVGKLLEVVISLPGRKFASIGTPASEGPIERRRGFRVPAVFSTVLVAPVGAALLKLIHLLPYSQASPLSGQPFLLPGVAESISSEEWLPSTPGELEKTAFVYRGIDFWQVYCENRSQNGAFILRLLAKNAKGLVLIKLMEVGNFRWCSLLALSLQSATMGETKQLGKSFRQVLKKLKVCVVLATEPDLWVREFLQESGVYVRRQSTRWWIIPRPSDTFSAQDVRWWLTSADRDSHWGRTEVSLALS